MSTRVIQPLKHFTGNAGIVLGQSNIKDPYKQYGKGAVKENYYADVLLWDGNPTKDINLILDESKLHLVMKDGVKTIRVIMKDGKIYKNSLQASLMGRHSPLVVSF